MRRSPRRPLLDPVSAQDPRTAGLYGEYLSLTYGGGAAAASLAAIVIARRGGRQFGGYPVLNAGLSAGPASTKGCRAARYRFVRDEGAACYGA